MKLNATYIKIRDKWWGLPLFLPSLILPIFAHINTFAHISSGEVFLFYLPLALMISMMMFFSWAALPGIALGIFVRKYAELGFYETLSLTANFIIIIILCWGGYRVFTPRRNNVSHGDTRLISQRIFWQIVFPATLFLILFQFAAFVGLLASRENLVGVMPFNLGTLINYQALLVGNLIGVPLCYFIIRVVRNPFYLRSYYSQLKQQVDVKVTKKEFALWLLALGALLLLLCMPLNEKSTIFSTNYTLSLLLPLMMWGAMRYGYKLISLLWAVVLMISIHSYQNYIPIYPGYTTQLTITSSSYLVFSFIVNYMAVLATRQRAVVRRIQRLAYVDPVVHLPNVRALNRALRDAPWSALCYLRIPGMEMLVKNYGIMLRIQYKQKLSHWLSPLLEPGEDVYQLSGNDLALRLNTESHQERITELDSHLKQFRFFWDGMPMQPQIGVSYCYVRSPVNHIYLLLGELNIFEVTESNALTNVKQAQITLQHLQELGCQIAIDDFGTGYASYARLKNVNADLLKIDGSFIRNIVSNSLDYQIVASICHLARMKKMRVVAEYVENEEIREAVLSLGIDYMQGYLIGKPQPLIDTLNEIEPIRESA